MQVELSGQVALVTGAARGIGKAIADAMAQNGARVVYADIDRAEAEQSASASSGSKAMEMDVTNEFQVQAVTNEVVGEYGRIDILVNNAGIRRDNLVMFMSESEWHDVLRVNLQGTFVCCKLALKPMIGQRWGRMINIVSPSGIMGRQGQANYAAAKGGVASFTKSLAREVAKIGITVNGVSPGVIETDMIRSLPEQTLAELKQTIPMGHFGRPEDVSGAVLFLASEGAYYITGQVVSVDGGLT